MSAKERLAKFSPREHPPTFATVAAALLAAVLTDLRPWVEQALPWLSDETILLAGYLVLGVGGGLLGKLAERWTAPWVTPPLGDGPEREELDG